MESLIGNKEKNESYCKPNKIFLKYIRYKRRNEKGNFLYKIIYKKKKAQ